MERICARSLSVSPSKACISSNLFTYLRWSRRILQSLLLMMVPLTIEEEIMSSTSCVTTTASPKNLRTVLKRYFRYSAMPSLLMAFQASSKSIILRMPFSLRILLMKVSIMMMVTIGKSTLLSLMLSNSKTINRLFKRSSCLSELRRKSYSPPL